MGAGATVFSALYNFDVRPTNKIAIVGLGGVGHLAVQFAHACDVKSPFYPRPLQNGMMLSNLEPQSLQSPKDRGPKR